MLFRYVITGGIAAVFDLCFFLVFSTWLGFNYLIVGGLGFLIATAINYIISVRIVFQSGARFGKKQEITAVYVVSGIGFLLHEIILYLSVDEFGFAGIVGKIIAMSSVFFWNYFLRKWYVFKET